MTSDQSYLKVFSIKVWGIASLYAVFGYIGLTLAAPPEYAMLIWPPAGIALGALLICDQKLLVGIAFGAIIFNISHLLIISTEQSSLEIILSAIGISIGSTFQAFIGFKLVEKYIGIPLHIKKVSQGLLLFILTGPVACMIAPTSGVLILYLINYIQIQEILSNWWTWWVGDFFGVLVFMPIMLLMPIGKGGRLFKEGINKAFPSLVIFAIMLPLGLTFYAWKISSEYIYQKNNAYFSSIVREAQFSLINRLNSYKQNLAGSSAYLMGKKDLNHSDWKTYVYSLRLDEYNPGINGLGIILDIPSSEISNFSKFYKTQAPGFKIQPQIFSKENFIITYIEPLESNLAAMGFNIASEKNRYEAAINARDTGNPTITKKITLVQDKSHSAGFLILHPIYSEPVMNLKTIENRRAHFEGWIYAPFIAKNFMESLSLMESHMLDLKVFDGRSHNQENLIFSTSDPNADHSNHVPLYTTETTIHILEQNWTLVWLSTYQFEESVESNEPIIILSSGLMVTTLLAIILLALSKRADNIELLIAEKTKELSASEEKFRGAMEYASIGKALVDLNGKFIKVNPSLCEFLGYSEDELMSLDFQRLTHPNDLQEDLEKVNALLSGKMRAYQMEKRYIHKMGNTLWSILSVSLVRDLNGQPKYFVSEINDITQKRELDRIKDEFISITSHELRTPITSVNLALNLLSKSLPKDIPEEITKFVDMAYRNSQRLILLINDILDLKKISAGMMEYHIAKENLTKMLYEVIEENSSYGRKYGVTFKFIPLPDDLYINVDANRLIQVISNFLSNAAKFSYQDGVVEIYMKRNNGKIRTYVKDYGVGIPLDFQDRIFQKFSQADTSMTRKQEGTGLGLFICKEMIEKMGGQIGFFSKEGEGATFWFDFDEQL